MRERWLCGARLKSELDKNMQPAAPSPRERTGNMMWLELDNFLEVLRKGKSTSQWQDRALIALFCNPPTSLLEILDMDKTALTVSGQGKFVIHKWTTQELSKLVLIFPSTFSLIRGQQNKCINFYFSTDFQVAEISHSTCLYFLLLGKHCIL